jgi:hypothetical protein
MGYDVHATRAENWADNAGHEIAAQEWLEIIKQDRELIPSPENGDFFVIWRGANKYPETWFCWDNGNISTKNPDKATFKKLLQIAQKLNAQIQGDDGEFYGKVEIENFDDSYLENQGEVSLARKLEDGIWARITRFLKKH